MERESIVLSKVNQTLSSSCFFSYGILEEKKDSIEVDMGTINDKELEKGGY
jgi:hypothetical protein